MARPGRSNTDPTPTTPSAVPSDPAAQPLRVASARVSAPAAIPSTSRSSSPGCLRSLFCGRGSNSAGGATGVTANGEIIGVDAGAEGSPRRSQKVSVKEAKALARKARNSVAVYHMQASKRPPRQATIFFENAVKIARRARNSILGLPQVAPEPAGAGAPPLLLGLEPETGPGARPSGSGGTAGAGEGTATAAAGEHGAEADDGVQVVAVAHLLMPAAGGGGGPAVAGPGGSGAFGASPELRSGTVDGGPDSGKISGSQHSSRRGAWENP